ncbi:MAG TPA: ABC transporter permease [Patescibacteria group bacterium]|nr:ABC transporter permease [Patescibacteria group bacterium]
MALRSKFKTIGKSLKDFWWNYSRNKAAVLGLAVVIMLVLVAIAAPLITPYSPLSVGIFQRLQAPSIVNIMGTDDLGRDMLCRVVYGSRISLAIGLSVALASACAGLVVGALSGYFGGRIDDLIMRITDVFQTIPRFFLAILLVALWGRSTVVVIFALSVLSWPVTARIVRAQTLSLREMEFVTAARSIGESNSHIIFREIVPNLLSLVIVNTTLMIASAIVIEAGLSFLGLGDPSVTSWGRMLSEAQGFLRDAWWMVVFPGVAISAAVLSFNLVGDGLNDAFNPKVEKI